MEVGKAQLLLNRGCNAKWGLSTWGVRTWFCCLLKVIGLYEFQLFS